jgi:hypothetical protein
MKLIIDTGSSWTWLMGEDCPSFECNGNEYNAHLSKTFKPTKKEHEITYGKGYVYGAVASDDVSFIREPTKYEIVTDQDFLLVSKAKDLEALRADGLIGLAPNSPSDHPYNTLVQTMFEQKLISKNVFSVYLGHVGHE